MKFLTLRGNVASSATVTMSFAVLTEKVCIALTIMTTSRSDGTNYSRDFEKLKLGFSNNANVLLTQFSSATKESKFE